MKSIMQSIRPKWCELIANGKKTIEVRKTRPKIDPPFKVYMYCTKASKKHQTVCGCMVLNEDELYRHPTQGIKYGDSIELMCCDDYTKDNFLNGKVIGEYICDRLDKYTAEFTVGNYYNDIRYHYFDTEGEEQEMIIVTNEENAPEKSWFLNKSCLSFNDIKEYIGINCHDVPFYSYHISELVIYDKPKELSEFYTYCAGKGNETDKLCLNCSHLCFDNDLINRYSRWCDVYGRKPLTRAPQSWCYAEEVVERG